MKVVIDTNILISGIFWSGPPRTILGFWLDGQFELIASFPILVEYRSTLKRISQKYGKSIINTQWNHYLEEFSTIVEPVNIGKRSRDPDDDKFIEAAIGGDANYIVSGDNDLLSLVKIEKIKILKAKEFISLW